MVSLTKREIRVIFGSLLVVGILYIVRHGVDGLMYSGSIGSGSSQGKKVKSMQDKLIEHMESLDSQFVDDTLIDNGVVPAGSNFFADNHQFANSYPAPTDLSDYLSLIHI